MTGRCPWELKRRRFGILTDADRVELIDGEIVEMSPIGLPMLAA